MVDNRIRKTCRGEAFLEDVHRQPNRHEQLVPYSRFSRIDETNIDDVFLARFLYKMSDVQGSDFEQIQCPTTDFVYFLIQFE